MKKVLKFILNLGESFFAIIIALLLGVFLVLLLPFDYIKYKRSLYYKTERKKYTFYAASGFEFDLYNEILRHKLPIKFIPNPNNDDLDRGWFVFNNTLIVSGVFDFEYDPQNNTWISIEDVDESRIIMTLDEYLETSITDANNFAEKNICNNAVVLIEADRIDNIELAKKEKKFIIYNNNIAETLKAYCENNI